MKKKVKDVLKSNKIIYQCMLKIFNYYAKFKLKHECKKRVIQRIKKSVNKLNNNNVYFLLDQCHGNLGDHAIGYAEQKFVMDSLEKYNVICILEEEYKMLKKYLRKIIKKSDVVALIGGGSLGNEYIAHENCRRDIIETFPNNRIISFPQTMFFSNDEYGKKELEKSVDVYSKHTNLTIVAREKLSYIQMKDAFKSNNIILTPDIVLYLDITEPRMKRQGALSCLRSDVEGRLTNKDKSWIRNILQRYFDSVTATDMHLIRNIDIGNREKELEDKFNQFKSAEVVITDRLHGMIFAAITGTPCIVMSNYNHKIIGTYDWIKHLEYIKYANELRDIPLYIQQLKQLKSYTYKNNFTLPYFENIIQAILGEFKEKPINN